MMHHHHRHQQQQHHYHRVQQHHHHHHGAVGRDTPSSRQDTLSPSPPSNPCSPEHMHQMHKQQLMQQLQQKHQQQLNATGQNARGSLQNLRGNSDISGSSSHLHRHNSSGHHLSHHTLPSQHKVQHQQKRLSVSAVAAAVAAGNSNGDCRDGAVSSDVSEMSEFVVGRVNSRLSIASKASSSGGGSKRGAVSQHSSSLTPVNNASPTMDNSPPLSPGRIQSPNLDNMVDDIMENIDMIHMQNRGECLVDEDDEIDDDEDNLSFRHYPHSYYDDIPYEDQGEDSGDNLSHDSYELIEREEAMIGGSNGGSLYSIGAAGGTNSQMGSRGPSRTSSRGILSVLSGDLLSSSREGLEWCESKGGGDMPTSSASSKSAHTGSLPRSHGGSVTAIINGYTGSLPRTHSNVSQHSAGGPLSRTLAGSRANSRITLELPIDVSPDKEGEDDDDLSSPGSPEFHENSVCEITSETGYSRHLGTITITDNVSLYTPQLPTRRLERAESLSENLTLGSAHRSRSNSRSKMNRSSASSRENLRENVSVSAVGSDANLSSRVSSASIRAAKEMGQYVDYGSSQESLHKMSSCESDAGSSMSSQTRSSTTPRPSDFHPHVQFLPARRSTSTSPPTITSGSSQPVSSQHRPLPIDFSGLHKKPLFHVYSSGRGSDSGGNTDSDVCSPLEIPLPIPSSEQVKEVDEEEEDEEEILISAHDDVLFLRHPPDLGLITRVRGSSDEEEENEEDDVIEPIIGETEEDEDDELACEQRILESEEEIIEELIKEQEEYAKERRAVAEAAAAAAAAVAAPQVAEITRIENDEIVVVIEENLDPFLFNFPSLPPHEMKEESPSSAEMDFTDASRDRKVDESEASERTVIERYHVPEDKLNKVGSKDSQMSIEEIDETVVDRRSSLGLERRPSYHESRKSPYLDRRLSNQDMDRISPNTQEKDRRSSYQEGGRKSPYLEARTSNQDLSRRSPYERDRTPSNSSDRSRRGSNSSDRRSSVSSDRHGSISSDRRGSASSDHKPPSLSDIGRRTSISVENDQRSPFFDTPAFEFDPPVFEFENENVFESVDKGDNSPPNASSGTANVVQSTSFTHSPPGNGTEHSRSYLDHSKINMDELTEALLPPEDSSDTVSSMSGARVVEVIDAISESTDAKKETSSTSNSKNNVQPQVPAPQQVLKKNIHDLKARSSLSPDSGTYEVVLQDSQSQKDVIIIKVDSENAPEEFESPMSDSKDCTTKRITPKIEDLSSIGSSYESNQDSQEKSHNGDVSLEGAAGGGSSGGSRRYHQHQDFYDDEDDHAQMSDHSSQSPDLVSEPDEYHDEYQEPEFYQPYRQMDVGYAFPSRTLSRISERSTTSEQEQEQDHLHSEHDDSKISTPTEDRHGGDIPSDVSSDYSNSNCEDAFSESKHNSQSQSISQTRSFSSAHQSVTSNESKNNHHSNQQQSTSTSKVVVPLNGSAGSGVGGALTAEEQENVNKFATHLFLCDLPEFCGGDDSDEFPSPPSSAFLENPHAELRQIESYYIDIAQKANSSKLVKEGIYDNIPVKFEGIHEVSESESGSDENHTLQEPEDDMEVLEELKNVKELEDDGKVTRATPTPDSSEDSPPSLPPHAIIESPPPPPPPRAKASLPVRSSVRVINAGNSGFASVVGTVFGAKPKSKPKGKSKSKSPSPTIPVCVPSKFDVKEPSPSFSRSSDNRDIHIPVLPGSPPSLSSLDSPDSQVVSRLPPYLPMLPSTPPSVSSLDSPDSQIFIMQPASPPASFANPESPCDSTSEATTTTTTTSCQVPGTESSLQDSITESTLSEEIAFRRREEMRHLDLVDFGQPLPPPMNQDLMELDFIQQKEIADLEMADLEHQQSLSGAELIEFQQQREMANLAIANLSASHPETSDFDLSPTSPFDMLDFSDLAVCDPTSPLGAVGGGIGRSIGGVTALDFEVIGGQLDEDVHHSHHHRNNSGGGRRSRGDGTTGDSSRDWS